MESTLETLIKIIDMTDDVETLELMILEPIKMLTLDDENQEIHLEVFKHVQRRLKIVTLISGTHSIFSEINIDDEEEREKVKMTFMLMSVMELVLEKPKFDFSDN
jgi:hypothetical protein